MYHRLVVGTKSVSVAYFLHMLGLFPPIMRKNNFYVFIQSADLSLDYWMLSPIPCNERALGRVPYWPV